MADNLLSIPSKAKLANFERLVSREVWSNIEKSAPVSQSELDYEALQFTTQTYGEVMRWWSIVYGAVDGAYNGAPTLSEFMRMSPDDQDQLLHDLIAASARAKPTVSPDAASQVKALRDVPKTAIDAW